MPDITKHEGKKYLRIITDAITGQTVQVDVYAVLIAFEVTCPATAHAIKKLLCAGTRGKGSRKDDLTGAIAAVNRAIELSSGGSMPAAVEKNDTQYSHP